MPSKLSSWSLVVGLLFVATIIANAIPSFTTTASDEDGWVVGPGQASYDSCSGKISAESEALAYTTQAGVGHTDSSSAADNASATVELTGCVEPGFICWFQGTVYAWAAATYAHPPNYQWYAHNGIGAIFDIEVFGTQADTGGYLDIPGVFMFSPSLFEEDSGQRDWSHTFPNVDSAQIRFETQGYAYAETYEGDGNVFTKAHVTDGFRAGIQGWDFGVDPAVMIDQHNLGQ